jgi:hypothetical protein
MLIGDHAVLSARFAARRCAFCGADDIVAICAGSDAVLEEMNIRKPDGGTLRYMLLRRAAVPEINVCLADWTLRLPFKSHKERRRRCAAVIA